MDLLNLFVSEHASKNWGVCNGYLYRGNWVCDSRYGTGVAGGFPAEEETMMLTSACSRGYHEVCRLHSVDEDGLLARDSRGENIGCECRCHAGGNGSKSGDACVLTGAGVGPSARPEDVALREAAWRVVSVYAARKSAEDIADSIVAMWSVLLNTGP